MLFQFAALFDSMKVWENVGFGLGRHTKMTPEEIKDIAVQKLKMVGLVNVADLMPSELSGGMRKRVGLARAIAMEPDILLYDEPTTGLDPIRKNNVHGMIAEYQQALGFTGVMVSHEIPDVFYISQRIAMLDEGRIIFQGNPEAIRSSNDPIIRAFIRGQRSEAAGSFDAITLIS